MNLIDLCIYAHKKQRAVFYFQVVLSKTRHVDNTLGKSINLLKCVCHVSLSFIDPFNNPIIKLMCYVLKKVNLFDTCSNETPLCLLIYRSDNTLLKSDYRK